MSTPARPVVGVGAVVWKGDRVLLIRRGHPPRQGTWTLPGGRQELGETVEQAVLREVREETGITVLLTGLVGVVDLIHREGDEIQYHYTVIDMMAEWLDGEAIAADDAEAAAWVDPACLDDFGLTDEVRRMIALSTARRSAPAGRK